jgi:hypothetical protein
MAEPFLPVPITVLSPRATLKAFFMSAKKYPYKTDAQIKRCAELQAKADRMADNIKHAKNKPLAVHSFLQCLYLAI